MNTIILYTTHCPKCTVLEKKLQQKNVKYSIIDNEDVMIKKGFMTSPMLEINGNVMDFSEAIKFVNGLE